MPGIRAALETCDQIVILTDPQRPETQRFLRRLLEVQRL